MMGKLPARSRKRRKRIASKRIASKRRRVALRKEST